MAGSLDSIVGHRIWLDYYDQNEGFDEAFTPQSCEVVKRFQGAFGEFDWYLIELDTPVVYEGRKYVNLMIRSRWIGYRIGDEDPTSVFIVLVPDAGKLTDPFSLDQDLFVAWGMAFKDPVASRNETLKRKKTKEVMQSIRTIFFDDWDPLGVNDIAPNDEYDLYVGGVYRLLVSHAADKDICEYLRQQEITRMELATTPEHRKMVVEKLKKIDVSLAD